MQTGSRYVFKCACLVLIKRTHWVGLSEITLLLQAKDCSATGFWFSESQTTNTSMHGARRISTISRKILQYRTNQDCTAIHVNYSPTGVQAASPCWAKTIDTAFCQLRTAVCDVILRIVARFPSIVLLAYGTVCSCTCTNFR
jgi:hypothetical protein